MNNLHFENIKKIEKLINNGNIDINELDSYGNTLIINAIENNKEDLVKLLLDRGADVNLPSLYEGKTPLMYSTDSYQINLIKLLLDNGADVNIKDNEGNSSLMYNMFRNEIHYNHYKKEINEILDLLVKKDGDINTYNNKFETPLLVSCKKEFFNIDSVRYLINCQNIKIDGNKYYKNSPIIELSNWNIIDSHQLFYNTNFINKHQPFLKNDTISCLITSLYNYNKTSGNTAFKNKNRLKIIIDNIKLIYKYFTIDGSESLILACEYEYLSIIHLLLNDYYTNIEICNNNGETPLLIACRKCNYKMVKLLLYYKANIYCTDYAGNTAFKNIYVDSNCEEKYKKILYLLEKYKTNNINIIGSKKIGIIAGHGIIDKTRFCRIPDGINIFTEVNKGNPGIAAIRGMTNQDEIITYTPKNIEYFKDRNKRKFYISKSGKILTSGTIIHDINISFIAGWDCFSKSISSITNINKIDYIQYSGIITDNCDYMKFNIAKMSNKAKIDEMFRYHNQDLIPNNKLISKDFYLSEILNIIKKNSINKDINTFIITVCRSAVFTNNNTSVLHPEYKLYRMNSSRSNYQKDFGNNLINTIKLINEKDLLINENKELNTNSLIWGLNFLALDQNDIKKFNYEKKRIINKLLNESYIDIEEFRFILNIKNKKNSEIKSYLKHMNDINIYNNNTSLSNNSDNYTITDIYNKNKTNLKKLAKLVENIQSNKLYNEINNNKKVYKNINNKIVRIIENPTYKNNKMTILNVKSKKNN